MKVMMVIAYDGSKFYGFQRQIKDRSVQGYLEETLSNLLDEKIEVKGAGRTDRGVHAKGQVVHFETTKDISNLKKKLNNNLKDLYIKKVRIVNDDFHARHSAKEKTYLYKLSLSNNKDKNYYGICKQNLNLKAMQNASKIFIGYHDFYNFTSGLRADYHSTIYKIKIYKFNDVIYFKFVGKGFFRYMVRNLVGALIEVGKGKVDMEVLNDMLELNSSKRLPTASPNGLYLVKIKY